MNKPRLRTINECLQEQPAAPKPAAPKEDNATVGISGGIKFHVYFDEEAQKIKGYCEPSVSNYKGRVDEGKASMINETFKRMQDDFSALVNEFNQRVQKMSEKYGFTN